ncbi:MAG: LysE family translocator [Pseudomonadales bacterium]|jgi:threonine/homoserine/homoserine lactone efflux protein|nr:LysE family translocator [Pseudomonadales bacterium]
MPLDILLTFLGASMLLTLAPGPDNLFVLTQGALYGPRAGICVTLGLCSGLIVHTTIAVLGLSSIFLLSSAAFLGLKFAGAAYLLYLAIGAWRAGASDTALRQSKALTPLQLYRRGIVMNLTNPKVGIFFIAFLPQFTKPEYGALPLQLLTLGAIFMAQVIVIFSAIAVLAASVAHRFQQSNSAQRLLNRASAVIFVLLALRLAFSQR